MTRCEVCGDIRFSKLEKEIYYLLPNISCNIARKLNKQRKVVNILLNKMYKFGVVEKLGKQGKSIIWEKHIIKDYWKEDFIKAHARG